MSVTDTIFAPATIRGQSGVAVVRISGPAAFKVAETLAGALPAPRSAGLRRLRDPADGALLDEALVLVFAAGASFTGEQVVELHTHGSVAVVDSLCHALARFPGTRFAEAGEFTRRAFLNGRLDLTEAEGLADLIAAETREQQRLATRVMTGEFSDVVAAWREDILGALALLEASIDFADEEIPPGLNEGVLGHLDALLVGLGAELSGYRAARRIRDGIEVAIVGRPNAGKSTLLNRLVGREAALTSEIAGTTRDIVEARLVIGGRAVSVLDTAGLREAGDAVERMGVSRAVERATAADIRVFLVQSAEEASEMGVQVQAGDLVVRGKSDLGGAGEGLGVSGLTGEGLPELFAALEARVIELSSDVGLISHARQREAVEQAMAEVETAKTVVSGGADRNEIACHHLRQALIALDSLVGRIDVEEVLGTIFSRFCIGK